MKKAYGTGCSQAVPHPSTIPARRCLTSVIGRERVYSSWYGRRRRTWNTIQLLYRQNWTYNLESRQNRSQNYYRPFPLAFYSKRKNNKTQKAYGTGSSQAVPHPSTIPARRCLTSVIGREGCIHRGMVVGIWVLIDFNVILKEAYILGR